MDTMIRNLMSRDHPGIAIAGLGLKKIKEAKDVEDAKLAGDCFLKAISDKGDLDEKKIASIALTASSVKTLTLKKALAIQKLALISISSGITSSLGAVVAGIGKDCMNAAGFFWDPESGTVGRVFLKGILEIGSDSEKALAHEALQLAQNVDCRAVASMESSALELMNAGLNAPQSQLTARIGSAGIGAQEGHGSKEAAELGDRIFSSIEGSGNPREKVLASMTTGLSKKRNMNMASLARFQSIVLSSIAGGISSPFSAALMKIGSALIDEKSGVDYFSRVFFGSLVTTALAGHAKGSLGVVADTSSRSAWATGDGIVGAEIERTLFEKLNKSLTGPVEKDLAKFCGEVSATTVWKATCENREAYLNTVKGIFLEAIRDHAEDPENSRIAAEALEATTTKGFFNSLFHPVSLADSLGKRDEALGKVLYREQAKGLENEIDQEIRKSAKYDGGIPGKEGEGSTASQIERFDDFVDIRGLKLPVSDSAKKNVIR